MSSDAYKFQVSIKAGARGELLINIPAATPDDLKNGLAALTQYASEIAEVSSLVHHTTVAAAGLAEGAPTTPAGVSSPSTAPTGGFTPAPAAQVEGKACPHGQKQRKNGTNAAGKAWAAWFCPAPKGTPGACDPEWIR